MFGHKRNMHKKQQSFSPTNIFEMIFFLTKHSSSSSTTTLTWGWSKPFRDQIHMGHSVTF